MKILMVNIPSYLKANCEFVTLHLEAKSTFVGEFTEANKYFEQPNDFDVIICFVEKFDKVIFDFFKKLESTDLNVLSIVKNENEDADYQRFKSTFNNIKTVDQSTTKEDLVNLLKEQLGLVIAAEKFDYIRIPIEKQLEFKIAFCDIYFSLSSSKYIKLLKEGDLYSSQDLEKYISKGIQYLYIKNEDFDKYSKGHSNHLNSLISSPNQNNTIINQIKGIEHIHSTALHMGVNEHVINDVNIITSTCLENLKKREVDIFKLLDDLSKNNNYLYSHGLLISYVASTILTYMGWSSPSTLEKIIISSLLHDLTLAGEEFLETADLDEKKIETMGWKVIKKVKNHPIEVADLIAKAKNLPPDVDKIILAHHEKPDGTGYPKGLNATAIAPMACVFIIAENFIHLMSSTPKDAKIKEKILEDFTLKYNKGNFKLPLEGFKKFLSE